MAEIQMTDQKTKYGKYLAEIGWGPESRNLTREEVVEKRITPPIIGDGFNLPTATHHIESWIIPEPKAFSAMSPKGGIHKHLDCRPPGMFADDDETSMLDNSPHYHTYDEVYLFTGTNPYDNLDLGGEVELWLGLGDQAEKFTFTKPTMVHIPAGLVHGPLVFRKVNDSARPISWVVFYDSPVLSNVHVRMLPPGFKQLGEED